MYSANDRDDLPLFLVTKNFNMITFKMRLQDYRYTSSVDLVSLTLNFNFIIVTLKYHLKYHYCFKLHVIRSSNSFLTKNSGVSDSQVNNWTQEGRSLITNVRD